MYYERYNRVFFSRSALAVVLATWAMPAFAQDVGDGSREDGSVSTATTGSSDQIIVTATRRSERLLDVPLSVSAVGEDELALKGANTAVDALSLTPSVSISQQANSTLVTIRGVGLDTNNGYGESNVAQYVDGVYQPRASSINLVFSDLDRVEVLRGPQGTLYGRNATGGAINFIPKQPTDYLEGRISADIGSHASWRTNVAVSGPLGNGVAARFSGFYDDFGGYGRNVLSGNRVGGNESYGGRLIVRADVSDAFTMKATGSYVRDEGSAPGLVLYTTGGEGNHIAEDGPGDNFLAAISPYTFGGGTVAREPFKVASWLEPKSKSEQILGALHMELAASDSVTLKSVTALQKNDTYFNFDAFNAALSDPYPLVPFISDQRSNSFTQELTANLDMFDDRLSLVLGAYYFSETFKGDNTFNLYGLGGFGADPNIPLAGFVEKTKSKALFFDGSFDVTDRFRLLAGARATWEKKDVEQRLDQFGPCVEPDYKLDYNNFSPKLGFQYDIAPDVMAYFTYQKGFKAGGFGAYVCRNIFDPEKITSYEAGLKASFIDDMLTLNLSAFRYDYKDLQVLLQVETTNRIDNAATSEINGGELEFVVRPGSGVQFDGNASILDATYSKFFTDDPLFLLPSPVDLSGNQLLRSPKFGARFGAQKSFGTGFGELLIRGELQHTSKVYFGAFNRPAEAQAGVTIFNVSARIETDNGWSVRGFVKNLTNETIINNTSIVASSATIAAGADPYDPNYPIATSYAPPRTWGIGLSKEF